MTEFDAENFDLKKFKEEFDARAAQIEANEKALDSVREQLIAAEQLFQKLAREKNQLFNSIRADRQDLREMEKELARQERLAAAKAKRDALIEEYNKQAEILDKLTATASWREFAFDHQIEGGKRLAIAERGILGDKRGLGKTLTSLIYLDMVQANKVLIIAPNDVVPQFEREIQHWAAHRKIMSFAGLSKDARTVIYPMLRMLDAFVITLNYEAWRRDKTIVDDLVAAGIDTIILDEAHRAKSSEKQTAQGIFHIAFSKNVCENCGIVPSDDPWYVKGKMLTADPNTDFDRCQNCGAPKTASVKNVLSMTGTPILNKPQELFTMLRLVDPMRFQSERQFLGDYCYSYAPGKWRFMSGGLERLTKSMSEFFVQRNRDDAGIHIPPPKIEVHYLEPDPISYPKQWKAYRDLTEAAALAIESEGETVSMLYILEIILRERQIMTWPAGVTLKVPIDPNDPMAGKREIRFDVEESQKLDAVEEFLNDLLEEEERVIVFSKFKGPLYELKKRLESKYSVTTATGDDPRYHKQTVIQDFDLKTAPKNPRWGAVFATYDAFATGVNLNAARHIIMIDDEWSPGMEDQAIGRIDRLNSTDQANVHIFRVNKSVDVFMERLIEEKKRLTEGFETSLSAADMLKHLKGE